MQDFQAYLDRPEPTGQLPPDIKDPVPGIFHGVHLGRLRRGIVHSLGQLHHQNVSERLGAINQRLQHGMTILLFLHRAVT